MITKINDLDVRTKLMDMVSTTQFDVNASSIIEKVVDITKNVNKEILIAGVDKEKTLNDR